MKKIIHILFALVLTASIMSAQSYFSYSVSYSSFDPDYFSWTPDYYDYSLYLTRFDAPVAETFYSPVYYVATYDYFPAYYSPTVIIVDRPIFYYGITCYYGISYWGPRYYRHSYWRGYRNGYRDGFWDANYYNSWPYNGYAVNNYYYYGDNGYYSDNDYYSDGQGQTQRGHTHTWRGTHYGNGNGHNDNGRHSSNVRGQGQGRGRTYGNRTTNQQTGRIRVHRGNISTRPDATPRRRTITPRNRNITNPRNTTEPRARYRNTPRRHTYDPDNHGTSPRTTYRNIPRTRENYDRNIQQRRNRSYNTPRTRPAIHRQPRQINTLSREYNTRSRNSHFSSPQRQPRQTHNVSPRQRTYNRSQYVPRTNVAEPQKEQRRTRPINRPKRTPQRLRHYTDA